MITQEVYFDTNVYTHIYYASVGRTSESNGVTKDDIQTLFKLLKKKRLRIIASITNVEETIRAYLNFPEEAVARLKIIGKIARRSRVIKYHTDLLTDDFVAFTRDELPRDHQIPPLTGLLDFIVTPDEIDARTFRKIAQETKDDSQGIRSKHQELYADPRSLASQDKANGEQPTFDKFWDDYSFSILESLATNAEVLELCKNKGMMNLLNFKSIRIAAFAHLSMSYAFLFEISSIETGYSRDMHHALLSSATGVFITHDKRLRRIMSRKLFPDYCVMGLKELLQTIS